MESVKPPKAYKTVHLGMRMQAPKLVGDKTSINVDVPLPRGGSSNQDGATAMADTSSSNGAGDDDRDDMY